MIIETVDGRPLRLRKNRFGWQVLWGRTVIAFRRTWRDALDEILKLYGIK